MDEFRAEVIRDIVEKFSMRSLVRVIPMKRDVMKIPTLTSGPIVTWTDENAVNFLPLLSDNMLNLIKITVNCWKTLTHKMRAISSQAYAVMRLKVQRLESESFGTVISPRALYSCI